MTETEWLSAVSVEEMLKWLNGKASERKLCLFAIACHRQGSITLVNTKQEALVVAESYAERIVTLSDLHNSQAREFLGDLGGSEIGVEGIAIAANHAAWDVAFDLVASEFPESHTDPDAPENEPAREAEARAFRSEQAYQCILLREIFGNLYRAVDLDCQWQTRTVVALARQMYESRDFGTMPILADALEDSGCGDTEVLNHCRGPGPHVRGCWLVDLILGKQ